MTEHRHMNLWDQALQAAAVRDGRVECPECRDLGPHARIDAPNGALVFVCCDCASRIEAYDEPDYSYRD